MTSTNPKGWGSGFAKLDALKRGVLVEGWADNVGWYDGEYDGLLVGWCDGCIEIDGATDGWDDGSEVGREDGWYEGVAVWLLVGASLQT